MSSHHFVREGQEPALFILDPIHYSEAEGLLEWAPLVLVAESALHEVLLWGIKIDVVLARHETVEAITVRLLDQAPIKVIGTGENFVETGLQFLTSINQPAVSIITNHFTSDIRHKIESVPHRVQVTIRTASQKWALIQSGSFKKWYQAGSVLQFSDENLIGQKSGLTRAKNGFKLSEDQWISIQSPKPFWVGEII